MRLNTISPAEGSKPLVSVLVVVSLRSGKTVVRSQRSKSRSGGRVKPGFEGGQMPIQRRLPKFGFTSARALLLIK